ncbi:MAG: hypothetical protein WCQ95_14360 [Bacteroidota bacterium]
MKNKIVILILLILTFSSHGQTIQNKRYLVITLRINNHLLYDNCVLERKIFDTNACLTLHFDTITSIQKRNNVKNRLIFDLDTLKSSWNFSIIRFQSNYGYYDDIFIPHNNGCFSEEDIKYAKNWPKNALVYLESIELNYYPKNTKVEFPVMMYYVRDKE